MDPLSTEEKNEIFTNLEQLVVLSNFSDDEVRSLSSSDSKEIK